MPKIAYIEKSFRQDSLVMIATCNRIIEEYAVQGFDLTLRQMFYQLVSRDIIENTQRSYKRLGELVNNARLAGMIDWLRIVDRTRNVRDNSHWSNPADIINSAARGYAIDKWADQEYRVLVAIEKDALVGVIEGVCRRLDVPHFSCRGYTSQSEMWSLGRRFQRIIDAGQIPVVLHLGDHDPSGIDMSRDITERLTMFMGGTTFERLALNMSQVEEYNPPPNPAKLSDSRANGYIAEFGRESWELDALEPQVIANLIESAVVRFRDDDKWNAAVERQEAQRALLTDAAERWGEVQGFLLRDDDLLNQLGAFDDE